MRASGAAAADHEADHLRLFFHIHIARAPRLHLIHRLTRALQLYRRVHMSRIQFTVQLYTCHARTLPSAREHDACSTHAHEQRAHERRRGRRARWCEFEHETPSPDGAPTRVVRGTAW
jgi:hypothetical protein